MIFLIFAGFIIADIGVFLFICFSLTLLMGDGWHDV